MSVEYTNDMEMPLREEDVENSSQDSNSTPTSNGEVELEETDSEYSTQPYTEKAPASQVGSFATIMNLLNSLLGAGILAVPNSMISCGLFPSLILLAAIATISYFSTAMEMKLQLELQSSGLDDLALKILGKTGQVILSVLTLAFCEVANLAYIIISGDTVISWFNIAGIDISSLWRRAGMILVYSIALPVALSIPRSMKFLSYISTVALLLIIFFVVAMIIKGAKEFPKLGIHKGVSWGRINFDVFFALSIYGLTFTLPITTLPIVDNYAKSYKKRNMTAIVSSVVCYFLVIIPGIIGYLLFGTDTKDIILENFENDDILMIIVRAGFFFAVTFSYPCMCQQIFASFSQLIYGNNDFNALNNMKRVIIHIVSHAIPIPIAMFFPQIKPVLGVGGALGGCIVGFSYPALLWYYHYRPQWKEMQFWLVWGLFAFGVVIAIVSITISVMQIVKK